MARNPFQFLYVGERVSPREFADIFSTELVQHAMPLFQPGHVVLSGANGTGKSMLFKLFDADVRLAYADAELDFPVLGEARKFIAAGINVNTARCNEFGNRRTPAGDNVQELMFGDFLNYYVVLDILSALETLGDRPAVAEDMGVSFGTDQREAAAAHIATDPVWEGYLEGSPSYESLKAAMRNRIHLYRRFMNGNDRNLAPELVISKSAVGEPMKRVVQHLRGVDAVERDTPFFILVDQYEELATILGPDGHKADFRSVVNRVLNSRDPTLSYRIGTRGYGWRDHLNVFGTDARLEQERDFKLVELDARLRRSEVGSTSIFPKFAQDVFSRRLKHAVGLKQLQVEKIADVFGRSFAPAEEAKMLTGTDSAARRSILEIPNDWPDEVGDALRKLADTDPLSARLGEAWFRQKGVDEPAEATAAPWMRKQWWVKERNELALLQIAGRRRQRAIYSGESDMIALSGGNILIFLSLCQLIWEVAAQASKRDDGLPEFPIKWELQTIGAIRAGRTWLDRITTEYGRSLDRFRLVQKLGEIFAERLLPDRQLSNPGQSGISLVEDELRTRPLIRQFLIEAVDYGNLVMTEHANRNTRTRRFKFYLNPLYCPIFRIPFQRIKEPLYVTVSELETWLQQANIIERLERPARVRKAESALPLFDMLEDGE